MLKPRIKLEVGRFVKMEYFRHFVNNRKCFQIASNVSKSSTRFSLFMFAVKRILIPDFHRFNRKVKKFTKFDWRSLPYVCETKRIVAKEY